MWIGESLVFSTSLGCRNRVLRFNRLDPMCVQAGAKKMIRSKGSATELQSSVHMQSVSDSGVGSLSLFTHTYTGTNPDQDQELKLLRFSSEAGGHGQLIKS